MRLKIAYYPAAIIGAALVAGLVFYGFHSRKADKQQSRATGAIPPAGVTNALPLSNSAMAAPEFVELCQRRAFDFFWREADPETGLIKDRAGNFTTDNYNVSSIASTGFGLSALAIGVEHGWITREQAHGRAIVTLRFFRDKMDQQRGWFYHFVDMRGGKRAWNSEVSSIDTALFLAGALFLGRYFADTEVTELADELYRRVDFQWMLTDGGARPHEKLLCHGWTPERGFLPYRWDSYSEHMILYLLAIGSPTHPIPAESWDAWARPIGEYAGYRTFALGPLFVHQFSHCFVDFREKKDRLDYDYFQSSVQATLANRQFCIDNAERFQAYGENVWGLSACDGPNGYRAYSALPGQANHDGTIAPWAAIASIVFTPDLSLAAMQHINRTYGERVWGRYGFSDAFNVDRNWWGQDVIGIDLGAGLLMLENHLSGLVWNRFMDIPYVQDAMRKAGFVTVGNGG
ncbi:MAG: hypothetical protein L0338_13990 [Acidobacteria bacterium]|nr:hypothetical protein [Acidobacteriota bacterium]